MLVQLVDLFLMELTNWRWSWRPMILTGTLAPLLSIVALGVFGRAAGVRTLTFILTGNAVISLMFGNLDRLQSRFSFMRRTGTLDYYATLPVHKAVLILAVVASLVLLSLPALLATVLAGSLLLGLPLRPNLSVLLVVPLAALSLAGIGALIGVSVQRPEEGGSLALLVTMALSALGPVIVPPERLPAMMLTLGWLSPATYAASAMRQALLGPVTSRMILDLAALAAFAAGTLWLVGRRMDWRQE